MRIRDMIKRLSANRNESFADDRSRLSANTSEDADEDVVAHQRGTMNTNEDAADDTGAKLPSNTNEVVAED